MQNFVLFLENKIVGLIVGGIKGVYLGIYKGLMIVIQTKIGQIGMILSDLFISYQKFKFTNEKNLNINFTYPNKSSF